MEDSTLVAFLSMNTTVYDIGRLWNGTLHVKTMLWSEAKDGMGIEAPDKPLEPSVGSAASGRLQVAGSLQPDYSSVTMERSLGSHGPLQQYPIEKEAKEDEGHGRNLQSNSKVIVDVLVCVTNRAMCQEAGLSVGCAFSETNRKPVTDKIALAFEVTNQAMRGVNVPVEVRIARLVYFSDGDANTDKAALDFLRNDPGVQKHMRDVGADLVTMFTGSTPPSFPAAGIAYLDSPESVNSVEYLSTYVFTHEIGTY
jgi:Metallo-peptidase family M12B Reprolysin-like